MPPPKSQSPPSSATATPIQTPSPIPPPVPVETHPNRIRLPSASQAKSPDPSRLAPEDAYKALSPPRLRPLTALDGSAAANAAAAALRPAVASLRAPPAPPPVAAILEQERRARAASRRRRKPHVWRKLLWIKQPGYPDNYTDAGTFLEHLQRNPNSRQYDFWPLMADSMVIVQHVCSMVVFVSAYAGIYQGRLSPVAVVACGTMATVVGWVMWDQWKREEESEDGNAVITASPVVDDAKSNTSSNESGPALPLNSYANGHADMHTNGHANTVTKRGLGLSLSTSNLAAKNAENSLTTKHGQTLSKSSFQSMSPIDPLTEQFPGVTEPFSTSLHRTTLRRSQASNTYIPLSPTTLPATVSHRNQARLKTLKSALLIFFALLGLSPILKSLTKSTSSDSIWALATWLLITNIFFFDYGSQYVPPRISTPPSDTPVAVAVPSVDRRVQTGRSALTTITSTTDEVDGSAVEPAKNTTAAALSALHPPPFPSSLSTNAALMASTVLASRLPTTSSVFSLTLFSIQVFGLFPIFRRHLRHHSYPTHIGVSVGLVLMASAGLGLILSQSYTHTYGDCGYCLAWTGHVALRSLVGILIGCTGTIFVTGGCTWWLISLQRYKDVVIGPWDPAKPILAGGHGRARGATD